MGHHSPGTGLSARQNCEPWEDMLTHWPSADQGEAWRGGPCTWWSSKVGLYEAPAGVTSTAGAWEGLVCRCCGRWRKTRPRPGETRESHESSSRGHQQAAEASAQPTAFKLGGACGIRTMQRGAGTPGTGQAGALLAFPEKSPRRPSGRGHFKVMRHSH